jgi:hypothetical protein
MGLKGIWAKGYMGSTGKWGIRVYGAKGYMEQNGIWDLRVYGAYGYMGPKGIWGQRVYEAKALNFGQSSFDAVLTKASRNTNNVPRVVQADSSANDLLYFTTRQVSRSFSPSLQANSDMRP